MEKTPRVRIGTLMVAEVGLVRYADAWIGASREERQASISELTVPTIPATSSLTEVQDAIFAEMSIVLVDSEDFEHFLSGERYSIDGRSWASVVAPVLRRWKQACYAEADGQSADHALETNRDRTIRGKPTLVQAYLRGLQLTDGIHFPEVGTEGEITGAHIVEAAGGRIYATAFGTLVIGALGHVPASELINVAMVDMGSLWHMNLIPNNPLMDLLRETIRDWDDWRATIWHRRPAYHTTNDHPINTEAERLDAALWCPLGNIPRAAYLEKLRLLDQALTTGERYITDL